MAAHSLFAASFLVSLVVVVSARPAARRKPSITEINERAGFIGEFGDIGEKKSASTLLTAVGRYAVLDNRQLAVYEKYLKGKQHKSDGDNEENVDGNSDRLHSVVRSISLRWPNSVVPWAAPGFSSSEFVSKKRFAAQSRIFEYFLESAKSSLHSKNWSEFLALNFQSEQTSAIM